MRRSTPTLVRNLQNLQRDRGYRWTDTDPILEFLRADITDSGWPIQYLSERSGVSQATLYNWMSGVTKHPRNATVEAVLVALGWERQLRQILTDRGRSHLH